MSAFRACVVVSIFALAAASGCLDAPAGAGGDAAPAAPSNLTVVPREGAAHVTWTDNSDDEDHFMVKRKPQGGAMYEVVATVPTDKTVYHDAAVTSGTTYTYQIVAMNAAGDASLSTEVDFAVP